MAPCKYRESLAIDNQVIHVCGNIDKIVAIGQQLNDWKKRNMIGTPSGDKIIAGDKNYCDYGLAKQ